MIFNGFLTWFFNGCLHGCLHHPIIIPSSGGAISHGFKLGDDQQGTWWGKVAIPALKPVPNLKCHQIWDADIDSGWLLTYVLDISFVFQWHGMMIRNEARSQPRDFDHQATPNHPQTYCLGIGLYYPWSINGKIFPRWCQAQALCYLKLKWPDRVWTSGLGSRNQPRVGQQRCFSFSILGWCPWTVSFIIFSQKSPVHNCRAMYLSALCFSAHWRWHWGEEKGHHGHRGH